ncbi:GNAT family N-acetyltransferase [Actinorugispora endophytica]|uniref:Acetyltransferase (GNAT) family protein n=1 Tax=Actinorugispora endophytica TaxID=1605990 RepID=A0A4R6V4X8_9ACTN|nr:GNAT family N-acetyltransferase [Actinorugispora endophytica]TDQ55391.1 acetyltransferase (GNAT) family protein [Actinorugispora endophytica]
MRDTSRPEGLVFQVPYVPTLGPMHPDAITPGLWDQVVAISGTGRFLPHDKDARWGGVKSERVLDHSVDGAQGMAAATMLDRGGRRTVRLHLYGEFDLDQAADQVAKLAADHGADRAQLVRLTTEPQLGQCCRIQLRTFARDFETTVVEGVTELDRLSGPVRDTWPDFTDALTGEGFAYLAAQERAGALDGPILTVTEAGRVVGAIGPMATHPDPVGRIRLLPQYFGVLPDHRGRGHGRALWRAAMEWGQQAGADYQVLQTELGGASDRLCRGEGLDTLGFVTTTRV